MNKDKVLLINFGIETSIKYCNVSLIRCAKLTTLNLTPYSDELNTVILSSLESEQKFITIDNKPYSALEILQLSKNRIANAIVEKAYEKNYIKDEDLVDIEKKDLFIKDKRTGITKLINNETEKEIQSDFCINTNNDILNSLTREYVQKTISISNNVTNFIANGGLEIINKTINDFLSANKSTGKLKNLINAFIEERGHDEVEDILEQKANDLIAEVSD